MTGGGGSDEGKDAKRHPSTNLSGQTWLYAQAPHLLRYEELQRWIVSTFTREKMRLDVPPFRSLSQPCRIECMSREHSFDGRLTSASIPFAQACSPLAVKPLLMTLSPTSARPVQARHSTSGVSACNPRHVLSALSDKKSDSR